MERDFSITVCESDDLGFKYEFKNYGLLLLTIQIILVTPWHLGKKKVH